MLTQLKDLGTQVSRLVANAIILVRAESKAELEAESVVSSELPEPLSNGDDHRDGK